MSMRASHQSMARLEAEEREAQNVLSRAASSSSSRSNLSLSTSNSSSVSSASSSQVRRSAR